jgi:RNA-directed DNA polymerase
MNHSNKIEQSMAESEEGRPLIEENTHQANTRPTQSGARVSQGLAGVRKAAREHKEMKFTACSTMLRSICYGTVLAL